jgi:hypothetical protein
VLKFNFKKHSTLLSPAVSKIFVLLTLLMLVISVSQIRLEIQHASQLNSDIKRNSSIHWLQPGQLQENISQVISNQQWSINFANIESILWQSNLNQQSSFDLSWKTSELFDKILSELPNNLTENDKNRLSFLIKQSTSIPEVEIFNDLLLSYYQYHQDYNATLEAINNAIGDKKLQRLSEQSKKVKALQYTYFKPKIAELLFSKKNTLNTYFNQRLLVVLNKNLSSADKKQKLSQLKKGYQASMYAIDSNTGNLDGEEQTIRVNPEINSSEK